MLSEHSLAFSKRKYYVTINILTFADKKIVTFHLFVQRMSIPAEQQPSIRPSRCFGGLVILITIHAKAEPNMNVLRILTGMNHLNVSKTVS